MTSPQDTLSVGMVGYAFMGAAHSQAWRNAPRFFDLPRQIRMSAVAGRDERQGRGSCGAARLGLDRDLVAGAGGPRRHRPDRHLHSR